MRISVLMTLAVLLSLASCRVDNTRLNSDIIHNPATASGETDSTMVPKIEFDDVRYDFGDITQGEKVTHFFKFENTGKSPLIITSAKGSCGCTVPSWPREAIAPGGKGEIKVVFDSEGKSGQKTKGISIVANTQPSTSKLVITGNIITPGG